MLKCVVCLNGSYFIFHLATILLFSFRKVASVSGDARRALDICRRAAEIAEAEGKAELVNMTHVNEALNLMITQPKVQAIKHCSFLEQLILQSIVGEVRFNLRGVAIK